MNGHEHDWTVTPGGALECVCGQSVRPVTEKEESTKLSEPAPELSPVEKIRVAAFGLDKPEVTER